MFFRYNVKATLQLVNRFLLIPGTLSTAKYAHDGELFARMKVEDDLSEDSIHGRLILQNCQTAWIMPDNSGADNSEPSDKVYEALIEDKGKNFIFLRISAACVSNLNLSCDQEFKAQVTAIVYTFYVLLNTMCDFYGFSLSRTRKV